MVNLGYTYYRNIDGTDVDFGKNIVDKAKSIKFDSEKYFDIPDSIKLTFKTTYPSLAIGLGYAHDTKEKDDFKLGFMFDFATGLPYIPGSSLKGTIRSMFPTDENNIERLDFINYILGTSYEYDELYEIEKSIFGKKTKDSKSKDDAKAKDIFYDSYFATTRGSFLTDDYITPHKDEITSPDPLKFLKILPDTKVILQIKLSENNLISKEDRLKLYSEILKWTGLGAKTNIGYGVIDNIKYEYENIDSTNLKSFLVELKELKDEKKVKKQKEIDEALTNNLSGLEKVKKQIASIEKDNNKAIYELIKELFDDFNDEEKDELFEFIINIIGEKPARRNPAKKRWAAEIYDLFGK